MENGGIGQKKDLAKCVEWIQGGSFLHGAIQSNIFKMDWLLSTITTFMTHRQTHVHGDSMTDLAHE